jgi:predicted nucleic acid-binding protein
LTPYVIDASVAVKWFVPEVHAAAAGRFLAPDNDLYAPDLLPSEFGNILWKKVRRDELTKHEAERIIAELENAPLPFILSLDLLAEAFKVAIDTERTVYDSMYLALAVRMGCQMVTADRKLYNSLQGTSYAPSLLWIED